MLRFCLTFASVSVITQTILLPFKTMESLPNRVEIYFITIPLFSKRTVSLFLLPHCHSVDAYAWCKWTLKKLQHQ